VAGGTCARCGALVDLHDVYVLGFHKRLRRMEWIYLCPDCEGELVAFLDSRKEGRMSRDPKLDRLRRKIAHAREDERAHPRKASRYKKKVAVLRLRIAKVVARRRDLDKLAILDGTPVTLAQKIALLYARAKGWDGVVNSGDRRSKIARILHALGKLTQAELYQGYIEGRAGFFPANPPTMGTHMRLGDNVIGEPGEPIPAWQQGLDTSFASQLREILRDAGFHIEQPYSNEEWHSNFMAPIKPVLIRLGLV
jgi:hypothetical protein